MIVTGNMLGVNKSPLESLKACLGIKFGHRKNGGQDSIDSFDYSDHHLSEMLVSDNTTILTTDDTNIKLVRIPSSMFFETQFDCSDDSRMLLASRRQV